MEVLFLIIFIILLVSMLVGLAVLYKKLSTLQKPKEGEQNLFVMLQNQIQDLSRVMDQKMTDTHKIVNDTQANMHKTIQQQFGQSVKIITDITEKLAKLDETNKQVVGVAEQLQGLENVLKNVMPPNAYQMQYKFSDGDIVDAVIFIKDEIIPIDSMFSLENYNRILEEKDTARHEELEKLFKQDLKKRIDETSKYIKPKEGTMDFAFMFIPAEGIYYDLLINQVGAIKLNTQDLIEYAFKEKHVIIVSPTSFFAYLQTVMQGLRALQIEESAKEIRKQVEQLGKHLLSYEEFMKKLGVSLGTVVNHYNTSYKEFAKIEKDVVRITDGERQVEPLQLEKPVIDN